MSRRKNSWKSQFCSDSKIFWDNLFFFRFYHLPKFQQPFANIEYTHSQLVARCQWTRQIGIELESVVSIYYYYCYDLNEKFARKKIAIKKNDKFWAAKKKRIVWVIRYVARLVHTHTRAARLVGTYIAMSDFPIRTYEYSVWTVDGPYGREPKKKNERNKLLTRSGLTGLGVTENRVHNIRIYVCALCFH